MVVEQLLTIEEASELTRLSVGWWRRAVSHGRVGSIKLGGAVRIRESEFQRLLANCERPAVERSLKELVE